MTHSRFELLVSKSYENPFTNELHETASKIATSGKGILAADESTPTIGSRFASIGAENTEENRRTYREMLFTTEGLQKAISGVILFEETLSQSTSKGESFVKLFQEKDIQIGIKVDLGTRQIPFFEEGYKYSVGFEQLEKRVQGFYEKGARFAKWRSVLVLTKAGLNEAVVKQVAAEQALYAAICQRNGLVPIVEPELLTDGEHSREATKYATEKILAAVFKALSDYNVDLKGVLLKPSMVLSGKEHRSRKEEKLEERIKNDSKATLDCLLKTVPPALPAVVFLSGGQSEEEATLHLNEMNQNTGRKNGLPWHLSFSFGRALQAETLKTWGGKTENVEKARKTFFNRFMRNSDAQQGKLEVKWENVELGKDLFVKNYTY